jgi:Spy/CpxP family protein refolding chaperone
MRTRGVELLLATCALIATGSMAQGGPWMMGPGMTGPGMMGPGMMGRGWQDDWYGLDLSVEQQTKLSTLQQEWSQRQWDLMGKMHQQSYRTKSFYREGRFDEQAARANFDVMNALHKEMFEAWLQARKQMDSILTQEQREQLQRGWRRPRSRG